MRNKFLFFLILVFGIILIVYFKVIQTDIIPEKAEENLPIQQEAKVDLAKMENNYLEEAKEILFEYNEKIEDSISEYSIAELSYQERIDLLVEVLDLKDRLLDLKVPAYFKALHLNLVLAFSKMESFIESGAEEERINALKLIEQARNSQSRLFE